MRGDITPLPSTPSCRGASLRTGTTLYLLPLPLLSWLFQADTGSRSSQIITNSWCKKCLMAHLLDVHPFTLPLISPIPQLPIRCSDYCQYQIPVTVETLSFKINYKPFPVSYPNTTPPPVILTSNHDFALQRYTVLLLFVRPMFFLTTAQSTSVWTQVY